MRFQCETEAAYAAPGPPTPLDTLHFAGHVMCRERGERQVAEEPKVGHAFGICLKCFPY